MKEVTLLDLLAMFDETTQEPIMRSVVKTRASHVVVMENQRMDSSEVGRRTALMVGPTCTYTLADAQTMPGFRLGDVPSRFQYPVAFAAV